MIAYSAGCRQLKDWQRIHTCVVAYFLQRLVGERFFKSGHRHHSVTILLKGFPKALVLLGASSKGRGTFAFVHATHLYISFRKNHFKRKSNE